MIDEAQIPAIAARARALLAAGQQRGIRMELVDHQLDDGWLYLIVAPTEPGGDAVDDATFMTEVERTLRREGHDQVLLIPSLPEYDRPAGAEAVAGAAECGEDSLPPY